MRPFTPGCPDRNVMPMPLTLRQTDPTSSQRQTERDRMKPGRERVGTRGQRRGVPIRRSAWSLIAVVLVSLGLAAPAGATPGPPLDVPLAKLQAGLHCDSNIASASKPAVLLVPGTFVSLEQDYGPNFMKLLPAHGYPVCTVVYPNEGATDTQVSVQYIVYAIRRMSELTGRRVDVIGHSQGAWLPGYALRFWPDLARKVDDFIGYPGVWTYGSDTASTVCAVKLCPAAFQQAAHGSKHMAALARMPFPAGPSYTSFMTLTDEAVTPQPLASTIVAPGARNFIQQDLCPLDVDERVTMIDEAPFAALALDALTGKRSETL